MEASYGTMPATCMGLPAMEGLRKERIAAMDAALYSNWIRKGKSLSCMHSREEPTAQTLPVTWFAMRKATCTAPPPMAVPQKVARAQFTKSIRQGKKRSSIRLRMAQTEECPKAE